MCTVADSQKKNEFFIRSVNKKFTHLSQSLSQSLSHLPSFFFFLLNISPVTLSSLSLKQTSLPPLISSRHLTPHAAERLLIEAAGLKLIKAAGLKLIEGRRRCVADRLISRRQSFAHQAATPPITSSHAVDRLLIKPPV